MGMFLVFVFILLIVGAVILVSAVSAGRARIADVNTSLTQLNGFTSTQSVVTGLAGLAVDERNRLIALIRNDTGQPVATVIPYRDILASEVFIDGHGVTRTSRTGQFGGALLGGLAFGATGAIIGGFSSGETGTTSEKVSLVELRLTINDAQHPIFDIPFHAGLAIDKSAAQEVIKKARHWHGLMQVVMHIADSEDRQTLDGNQIFEGGVGGTPVESSPDRIEFKQSEIPDRESSTAKAEDTPRSQPSQENTDKGLETAKLKEWKEAGVISEDEFLKWRSKSDRTGA